ncbi:MAG TPA: hypothetical protein PKY87_10260 [Terricaulis sp.]|nr:hypothetical protein [Terricaulis sp.]
MRLLVPAVLFALAACAEPAPPQAEPASPAAHAPAPIIGAFTAISTTAMSLTGDLDASADVLSFARGFRIEGPVIESALTGDTDLSAGGGTISSGSGVQNIGLVELRRIDLVRVAADAPAPQLCGDAQATFAILARGAETLSLQLFSGAEAPGPNAHDTALCGIFNYAID